MAGETLTDTVVQSVANLAAIALERARGQDAITRAEAARHSGELRATLLDAVAHEFKTPLTSVKAAASALAEKLPAGASEHELATMICEESDRLEGLVNDVTQVLRLQSVTSACGRRVSAWMISPRRRSPSSTPVWRAGRLSTPPRRSRGRD